MKLEYDILKFLINISFKPVLYLLSIVYDKYSQISWKSSKLEYKLSKSSNNKLLLLVIFKKNFS